MSGDLGNHPIPWQKGPNRLLVIPEYSVDLKEASWNVEEQQTWSTRWNPYKDSLHGFCHTTFFHYANMHMKGLEKSFQLSDECSSSFSLTFNNVPQVRLPASLAVTGALTPPPTRSLFPRSATFHITSLQGVPVQCSEGKRIVANWILRKIESMKKLISWDG